MTLVGEWRVLSRPDCSLCEAMLQQLVDLLGEQAGQVMVQDISDDAELERKYGQRIPVLIIDGEFVCAYRLDQSRIQPYLVN
jgi:Glutaredoxin-like domain (DUF836)